MLDVHYTPGVATISVAKRTFENLLRYQSLTDRHFLLADDLEVQELSPADTQSIWNGEKFVSGDVARLISVFFNDTGRPHTVFTLKLSAPFGLVTAEARSSALDGARRLLQNRSRRSAMALPSAEAWADEHVRAFFFGWPPRELLQRKLADAMGLKPWHFGNFAIGGPLLESVEFGEDVHQSIRRIAAELAIEWQPRPRQFDFCQVDFAGDNGALMLDALHRMQLPSSELAVAASKAEVAPHSPDRQDAIVRLVEFLVLTTFGYGRRYTRFKYLATVNPDIYRLSFGRSALVVNLDDHELIPLGRVNGFSGILPLTLNGFDRYRNNHRAASELSNEDGADEIVASPYEPRTISHVLISGVVYLPSVPRMLDAQRSGASFSYGIDRRYHLFANEGGELFRECFLPHLWQFLTPVKTSVLPGGPRAILGENQSHWPKVVCPISGLGMGEPYLMRAGFAQPDYLPMDCRGNQKYIFDLSDINSQAVDLKRRTRMAHLAEAVGRRLGQPLF